MRIMVHLRVAFALNGQPRLVNGSPQPPLERVAQSRNSGTIQNGFCPRDTRSKLSKALRQRFQ